jgi:hypothetical protein
MSFKAASEARVYFSSRLWGEVGWGALPALKRLR